MGFPVLYLLEIFIKAVVLVAFLLFTVAVVVSKETTEHVMSEVMPSVRLATDKVTFSTASGIKSPSEVLRIIIRNSFCLFCFKSTLNVSTFTASVPRLLMVR